MYVEWHWVQDRTWEFSVWGYAWLKNQYVSRLFDNLENTSNLFIVSSCWSWIYWSMPTEKNNLSVMCSSNDEWITIWNNSGKKFFWYHIMKQFNDHPEYSLDKIFSNWKKGYINSNYEYTVWVDFSLPKLTTFEACDKLEVF